MFGGRGWGLNQRKKIHFDIMNHSLFSLFHLFEAAVLLAENGMTGIMYLFRRGTHEQFGYASLFTALIFYFLLSCLTAGSAVASGLVIPML